MQAEISSSVVELELDYKKISDSAEQARFLSAFVCELINKGKRVAISYSANDVQARKIFAAYAKGNNFQGCINGRNQAASFSLLVDSFPAGLKPQFRILPFATIMKGGSEDDPVGTKEVVRDLSNLVQHVEQGWTIVMLTNPLHLRSASYFQIGGGKALHFYHASKRSIPFENAILSQGAFVERIVKLLQSGEIDSARVALKAFQDVLLDSETKTASQLNLADPLPLVWWVRKQLVELHLLPGTGNSVADIVFSPSFNLRILCETEAVLKSLQKPLSKFRAESLAGARASQLSKTQKKSTESVILSIPADQVVPFLSDYCKIPFNVTAMALAKRISKGNEKKKSFLSRAATSDFVVITPLFLVFGDSLVLSVDDALEKKLLGSKYTKKGVDIDPTIVAIIIKALQMPVPASGGHLRFAPWLQIGDNFDDDWKEIVQRYNTLTATVCSVFKDANAGDILAGSSEFRNTAGRCMDWIINETTRRIADASYSLAIQEYWLHFQVATLAFFRGNFFLCSALLHPLCKTPEIREFMSCLGDGDRKALNIIFSLLYQKDDSYGQFDFRQQVILTSQFARFHGPCLLNYSGFTKWMVEGENKGKGAKEKMKAVIESHLSPIIKDVAAVCQKCPFAPTNAVSEVKPSSSVLSTNMNAAIKWATDHHSYMQNMTQRSLWKKLANVVGQARFVLKLSSRSSISDEEVFHSCVKLRGRVLCEAAASNPAAGLLKQDRSDLISYLSRFALFECDWMENASAENGLLAQEMTVQFSTLDLEDDE